MSASTVPPVSVQCPDCGGHTIVQCQPNVYACLKCDFKKDFTARPETTNSNPSGILVGGLGLLLTIILLL